MIVALKDKDSVVIGVSICDSTVNMSPRDLTLAENLPLWKPAGTKNCYVATDTLNYAMDILRCHDSAFKDVTDGRSVIEKVQPKIRAVLEDYHLIKEDQEMGNSMVIIKDNQIFEISNYFCVSWCDEYGITSYRDYVEGVLEATADMPAEKRVVEAFDHVSKMTNQRLFPMVVFSTKSKRRKVYYSKTLTEDPTALCVKEERADEELKEAAIRLAKEQGKLSISTLMRHLKVGYVKAGEIERALKEDGYLDGAGKAVFQTDRTANEEKTTQEG